MNKIELLAPAGNLSCGIIAAEAGADAIYAGYDKFNARQMAKNFSYEDLSRLSEFLKNKNKKLYITMNTLLKERELEDFYQSINLINKIEPDAIIVQDLGAIQIIKENFPNLDIHSSTQMGIHNSLGVEFAKSLGISRVILERQIYKDELELIAKNTDLELEIFVHGALCCSLSGVCLFSSSMGGFSGNRGRCKQPCRRLYTNNIGKTGYFLSPKDLETLELVNFFRKIGITSLKIEGRLKKEDYIKNTVEAYRQIIDNSSDEGLALAKKQMKNVVQRKTAMGFYTEESLEDLIEIESRGVFGNPIGKIGAVTRQGIEFVAEDGAALGDRLRVQNKHSSESQGFTLTRLFTNRKAAGGFVKGDKVFVPTQLKVQTGDAIYKIASSVAGQNRNFSSLQLFEKKPDVALEIEITASQINIFSQLGIWSKNINLDQAKNQSLKPEFIEKFFEKSLDNKHNVKIDKIKIEDNLFFPSSRLKEIKQEFWTYYESKQVTESAKDFKKDKYWCSNTDKRIVNQDVFFVKEEKEFADSRFKIARKLNSKFPMQQVVLPFFTAEDKLDLLKEDVKKAYDKGIREFRITSISHLELLKNYKDIQIYQSFPLPVCNSYAVALLKDCGLESVLAWPELDKEALMDFCEKSILPVEVPNQMPIPLLITRAEIASEDSLTDARGNQVLVEKEGILNYVYSDKILELPEIKNCSKYIEAVDTKLKTFDFNYSGKWV